MESQPQNPEFRNNPELSPIKTDKKAYTALCRAMNFSTEFDTVIS